MKLVFPNGEHPQALLMPGINRIGAAADNSVILNAPSMPPVAADIHLHGPYTNLVPNPDAEVTVNGHVVRELITLRSGDRIQIAGIQVNLAALPPGNEIESLVSAGDAAATSMMAAVPKYLLRGISGSYFGKVYPLSGPVVLGRAPECQIVLSSPQVSRRHAELRSTPEGVLVQDLGSANGVWVNDKLEQRAVMKPGDELRIDINRFRVDALGAERTALASVHSPSHDNSTSRRNKKTVLMLGVVFGVALAVAIAALAAISWKVLVP